MTMEAPPIQVTAAAPAPAVAGPALVDTTSAEQVAKNTATDKPSPFADAMKAAGAGAGASLTAAANAPNNPDPFHMVFGGGAPQAPKIGPSVGGTTQQPMPSIQVNQMQMPAPVMAPAIVTPPPIAPPAPPQTVSDRRAKVGVRPAGRDVWSFLDALASTRRTNGGLLR